MFKKITKLAGLYKRYGFKGLALHNNIRNNKNKLVSFIYPKEFKHPVYLRTGSSDYPTFREVILEKGYEYSFPFDPKVIIDCGANIGLTSVFFKNKYPNAKLFAIEPEKNNFEILSKNLEHYNDTVLYNNGIWNKTVHLKIEDPGFSNWGFMVYETKEEGLNTIPAISIKDIMLKNNLGVIDILKIDIEGSEKELFESDYDYWLPKTKVIIIELHDRLRQGASQSFFKAIIKYNFTIHLKGQNIFCFFNQ